VLEDVLPVDQTNLVKSSINELDYRLAVVSKVSRETFLLATAPLEFLSDAIRETIHVSETIKNVTCTQMEAQIADANLDMFGTLIQKPVRKKLCPQLQQHGAVLWEIPTT